MEQYSNLNVHGKIRQRDAQGTTDDDVVKYETLEGRVPSPIPEASAEGEGMALIVRNTAESGQTPVYEYVFGEAGKVDEVQINGTTIAPTIDPITGEVTSKVANIPKASTGALGVVKIGNDTNISIDSNGVISSPSLSITNSDAGNLVTNVTAGASSHAFTVSKAISYSTDTTGSNIVQRQSNGQITVPSTPAVDTDAASKGFVNSSIATNTANFLGTYDATDNLGLTVTTDSGGNITAPTNAAISTALSIYLNADYTTFTTTADYVGYYVEQTDGTDTVKVLVTSANKDTLSSPAITPGTTEAYPQVSPTPNDYVFVSLNKSTTTDVDEYRRFKASKDTSVTPAVIVWEYEYTLNNSSFTQAQWNAINSGIEASDVSKLDGIEAGAQVNIIETVKVNNTALTVTSKAVDIPAATTSAFGVVEVGSGTALAVSNGVITSLVTASDVVFTDWPEA